MRVTARRREGYVHDVEIEGGAHRLVVDEPAVAGGTDAGPAPTRLVAAGLATCIAITMEMYADRKGWELDEVVVNVDVEYEKFTPSSFAASVGLPAGLTDEQRERLLAIAGKCPVHRVVAQETAVSIDERPEGTA